MRNDETLMEIVSFEAVSRLLGHLGPLFDQPLLLIQGPLVGLPHGIGPELHGTGVVGHEEAEDLENRPEIHTPKAGTHRTASKMGENQAKDLGKSDEMDENGCKRRKS